MQDTDPDWDLPLSLTLTPAMLVHGLLGQAHAVHTGIESCVDPEAVLNELRVDDRRGDNYVRLVEQEYAEDDESIWHDWTLEMRIADVLVVGHWQQPLNTSPLEWEWCAQQAEQAFSRACVLFGKQVRSGLVIIDEPPLPSPEPSIRRH